MVLGTHIEVCVAVPGLFGKISFNLNSEKRSKNGPKNRLFFEAIRKFGL